jgi:DNA-binding CsgD family transcriptional regulator/tetratricopeptide (TPR) repeat protein
MAGLSAAAVQVMEVASVFGDVFSVDDVASLIGEPVARVLPALREALSAHLLVPSAGALAFRHQLLRSASYARIPEPLRAALHRQAGAMLLERGGSAVAAAAHLIAGSQPGDRAALPVLDRAAQDLIAAAPRDAVHLALWALQLTDAGDQERFARTVTAVNALLAAERVREAVDLARATLALPRTDVAAAAQLRVTVATILLMSGQAGDAVAESDSVLAERDLPNDIGDAAELVRLRALLAAHDLPRAQAAAEAILAGQARPGGDAALAVALAALARTAWHQGRVSAALGLARAAVQRGERAFGGGPVYPQPRLWLAGMLTTLGEFEEAADLVRQAEEHIQLAADTLSTAVPALYRARLCVAAGRLEEAYSHGHVVLATAEDLGTRLVVAPALAILAEVALLRGDLTEAARYVERYEFEPGVPGPRGAGRGATVSAWLAARLADARDGPTAAMKVLDDLYVSLQAEPDLLIEEPAAAAWLVRVALAVGDRSRAEVVVGCAEQLALANPGVASLAAAAGHARGLFDRDAVALARVAAEHRQPWAAASAAEDSGVALVESGDRQAARGAFGRALVRFERAGADRDAARVRSRLREVGVRRGHWRRVERPLSGWSSLTDTEQRVAHLVAEGLTNPQVGDRLFLSRHTVDFHLRKIFRKLDVTSRVELTRLVLESPDESGFTPAR